MTERKGRESLILTSYHFNYYSSNRYNSNAKVGRSFLKIKKIRLRQFSLDPPRAKDRYEAENGCKDNEKHRRTTTNRCSRDVNKNTNKLQTS